MGISKVVHKEYFAVDEYVMEAATATGVVMPTSAAPERKPKVIPVNCDRLFLWGIGNRHSKVVLFLGRITDPTRRL